MKRWRIVVASVLVVAIVVVCGAQSKKLSELTATATLSGTDLLYALVNPSGVPADKKITVDNLRNVLFPVDMASKATGGSGTAASPWTGWDAAIDNYKEHVFQEGYYAHSNPNLNFGKVGARYIGRGRAVIRYTGTTPAPIFRIDFGNTWHWGGHVENLFLDGAGNQNAKYGFYMVGLRSWLFEDTHVINVSEACYAEHACVGNVFMNIRSTKYENVSDPLDPNSWAEMNPKPYYMFWTGTRPVPSTGDWTTQTEIHNGVFEGTKQGGFGIFVDDSHAYGLAVHGGTVEAGAGGGIYVGDGSAVNTFDNLDLEANADHDMVIRGEAAMRNTFGNKCSFSGSSRVIHDNCTFRLLDPYPLAEVTINPAGVNNAIRFSARTGGTAGNSITVTYDNPGGTGTIATALVGNAITVTLGRSAGVITSTANDVLESVRAHINVNALIECHLNKTSDDPNDGSGLVTAIASTTFSGGNSSSSATVMGRGTKITGTLGANAYGNVSGSYRIDPFNFGTWIRSSNSGTADSMPERIGPGGYTHLGNQGFGTTWTPNLTNYVSHQYFVNQALTVNAPIGAIITDTQQFRANMVQWSVSTGVITWNSAAFVTPVPTNSTTVNAQDFFLWEYSVSAGKWQLRDFLIQDNPRGAKKLGAQTIGTTEVNVPHGLGRVPKTVWIDMTSAGQIWQSTAADATNIKLTADAAGRTCTVDAW